MLKAKENLKNITIAKDEGNKTFVYTSEKFKLKKKTKFLLHYLDYLTREY
ncbi:hypothetical protein NWE61_06605 [Mycoplasmopsis felis]|nr:hypothetical protein [Mycoplasmopsis felis]MCU9934716.1 hypothetical protein [Mycoplasmopsis felis]